MNIGIDIIENPRFRQALKKHPRLMERVFTHAEQDYCRARPDPVPHFAVRFAAKEAVGKALGTGVSHWREIEISGGGPPRVSLSGATRERAEKAGTPELTVSLSHGKEVSVAVAIAAPPPA